MKKTTLAVSLILLLAGCAEKPIIPASGVEGITPGMTGIILPVTLSPQGGVAIAGTCKLALQRHEDMQKFYVDVQVGDHPAFISVPTGTYAFFDLNCGRNQNWDFTTKQWAPLLVATAKVSMAAPVDFRINGNGGMTTFFSNRNAAQKALRDIFAKLQPDTQNYIVSAYNKKQITAKMTQQTEYQITVKLPPHHVKAGEPDDANYPDFKTCYSAEFPLNPLYAGSITLGAIFKNKVFRKIDLHDNFSTYTDDFYSCAQNKLKSFVPNRSDELTYEIVL
jgi:hypothetical protein